MLCHSGALLSMSTYSENDISQDANKHSSLYINPEPAGERQGNVRTLKIKSVNTDGVALI